MASLLYETIYSSLLRKVTDYDFLKCGAEEDLYEYMRSAVSKPYCRRLFSSLEFDDENQEITYELAVVTDESQDNDFVTEMLSLGMLIEWLEPLLNSKITLQQMITSSKESKWYSQKSHGEYVSKLYDDTFKKQRDLIRDRGYIYNSYLGGGNGQA